MAQSTTFDGQSLIIPGAYTQTTVQNTVSGLSSTGILMLVGEADSGPDFSSESDLNNVTFGPDQQADVLTKYKSGRLVDAFRGAVDAANDPQIQGSVNRIILMKTNVGTKASSSFNKIGGGVYGTFFDKSWGKNGNLINYTITQKTAESVPSVTFTMLLPIAACDISFRANGGSEVDYTVTALETPTAFVSAVGALTGMAASGGANRGVIAVSGTLAVAVSGTAATITRSVNWAANPVVGDTLYIPSGSVIAGAGSANCGSYVVTAVTSATVTATKLRNASGSPGTVTNPVAVSATNIVATTDLQVFAPVTVALASATSIPGVGKSLEFNELSTNTDLIGNYCYSLNSTPVTFISKSSAPKVITSLAEYGVNVNVSRALDSVNQTIGVDGKVAFRMGYKGTSCSVLITATALTTTVSGGSGANLAITLSDWATIADMVTYINSQPGYNASVETATIGLNSPLNLDEVSFTCGTTWGDPTGRVKLDAYNFLQGITNGSSLVQLNNPVAAATAGFPDVASVTFLSGGSRGGTSNAQVFAAMDALQAATGNFLVPLFSQDASLDIVSGDTDSSSTYTVDAINAYANTHVLTMSQIKRRRNRQAFLSKRDTFVNVQNAAANIASARCSMAFQDIKDVGLTGIVQFQPWMGAIKAAGMQAAAFYRSIFNKGINCSGVLQAAGDYTDTSDTDVEDALNNGLLPAKRRLQGGYTWVSDQTTYTLDNNFVFNSIQAMYAADTVALTIAQRMEQAFLGQSLADVSAALALSSLSGICFDLLRQKLLAPSDGAPSGFTNANIRIVGPVMYCNLSITLSTCLYFIPISIMVQEVTQTANQ